MSILFARVVCWLRGHDEETVPDHGSVEAARARSEGRPWIRGFRCERCGACWAVVDGRAVRLRGRSR